MGTYYTNGASKADIIRELLDENAYTNYRAIAHSVVGNNLWIVMEKKPEAKTEEPLDKAERFLTLALLRSDREGWGYKPMDESMGPYESDCPLKYIDMVPDPGGYATAFRERVRAFHAEKARRSKVKRGLTVGQIVKLAPGIRFKNGAQPEQLTVASTKPLRGRDENGTMYRLAPRLLAVE